MVATHYEQRKHVAVRKRPSKNPDSSNRLDVGCLTTNKQRKIRAESCDSEATEQAFMDTQDHNPTLLDLVAIGTRVRQAINSCQVDGTDFAAAVGIPYSTMRSYLSGSRAPSAEFLTAAFMVYGISPAWLLTGHAPMKVGGAVQNESDDYVSIPLLNEIHASAGHGSTNEPEAEYTVQGLAFSRAWLMKRGLSAQNLRVIEVKGQSMEPVLSDADRVLIDMSDTQPRSGYVYVLRQASELLVKYCQLLPAGVLRVSSANQQFAAYDVKLHETADVQIVGRVVASMHEW